MYTLMYTYIMLCLFIYVPSYFIWAMAAMGQTLPMIGVTPWRQDLSRYLQIPDEELNAVEEETGAATQPW